MLPASFAAWVPVFMATPDVGLRQRRRVVGAVAGHRDEVAARLLALDQRHLVLGRGLGEEVVDARLRGDRRAVRGLSPVIITVRMPILRTRRSARSCPA
jgi:hypothetical protein